MFVTAFCVLTTQIYPEIIVNTVLLLYGNSNKQRGVSSIIFELVSIITIYLGGSNCEKI
jgi:hypothetical protein